jgi:transposase-like protein
MSTNGHRTYTDEERQNTLALYIEVGPREAARRTGVPLRTISNWAHNDGVATDAVPEKTRAATEQAKALSEQRRAEKRDRLRELLLDRAVDLLERMDSPHSEWRGQKDPVKVTYDKAEAGACQQYAVATGILIDKYRLEVGESTSRSEVSSPSRDVNEGLRDELAARRAG